MSLKNLWIAFLILSFTVSINVFANPPKKICEKNLVTATRDELIAIKKEVKEKIKAVLGLNPQIGVGDVGGEVGIRIYIQSEKEKELYTEILKDIHVPVGFVLANEIRAFPATKPIVEITGPLVVTPAQIEGPYYPGYRFFSYKSNDLTKNLQAIGKTILIEGRLTDQNGNPIAGARIDLWQTDGLAGKYKHPRDPEQHLVDPGFASWGATATRSDGSYRFRTVRPLAYPASADWMRPDHLHFMVYLDKKPVLITQTYFTDDPWLSQDHIFQALSPEQQKAVLVDLKEDVVTWVSVEGPRKILTGKFNIVLNLKN